MKARPLLTRKDFAIVAWLAFLLPIAWLMPQRLWTSISQTIAASVMRLTPQGTASRVEEVRRAYPHHPGLPAPRILVLNSNAGRVERNLQYLREFRPGGWNPRVELVGGEHIDRALESGKGCIAWVALMTYAYLVAKKGLHAAGFPLIHLGGVAHGMSQSRLGRPLNLARTYPEDRYLAERLLMAAGSELRSTREVYARLQANALVSITATDDWGARIVTAPFLGGEMGLASGAPSLALATGAALLPVFAIKRSHDHFEVIVEPALAPPRASDRHEAVDELVRRYVERVEVHVARHPEQYTFARSVASADPTR